MLDEVLRIAGSGAYSSTNDQMMGLILVIASIAMAFWVVQRLHCMR